MNKTDNVDAYLDSLKSTLDRLDRNEIARFLTVIKEAHERDAAIYIFGNGGSASTAAHITCDLNKGVSYGREKRFRVFHLGDNVPTIMAYANDVSYDDVFVEQLKNFIKKGDVAIGMSGSGNSKNVIKAIEYANSIGAITVGISGFRNNRLKATCHCPVSANVDDIQIAEDIQMILGHIVMKALMGESNSCAS